MRARLPGSHGRDDRVWDWMRYIQAGEPMKATPSFSQRLRAGESKEQLMKHYVLTEAQYQKIVMCLDRIKQEASV
jgi:hypothetical protein